MTPALSVIIIYAKEMQKTAEFYQKYFDFVSTGKVVDGLIELTAQHGGASILIHQAAKSVKLGQAGVKLMFDVEDVEAFKKNRWNWVCSLEVRILRTAILSRM
jgi:predicted enzyme related to lactoylglutathione lyase